MSGAGKSGGKGGRGKKAGGKSQSRSARAGLQFPVGRVSRFLRKGRYGARVGGGAPVRTTLHTPRARSRRLSQPLRHRRASTFPSDLCSHCHSLSLVFCVCSSPVVVRCTCPLCWSTWLLRFLSWLVTPLATTSVPASPPATFSWPSETTRNSTSCWAESPSPAEVCCRSVIRETRREQASSKPTPDRSSNRCSPDRPVTHTCSVCLCSLPRSSEHPRRSSSQEEGWRGEQARAHRRKEASEEDDQREEIAREGARIAQGVRLNQLSLQI